MGRAAQWLGRLKGVVDGIGALFFLAMFSGFIIQVFYRYVLNHPLAWTEEFTLIMSLWTVFWATAFMVPIRDHVSLDIVYLACPPPVQRVLAIAATAAVIGAFLCALPGIWDYVAFMGRKKSAVMRWPMHLVFGCYILFVLGYVAQSLWRLRGLISKAWRDYLDAGSFE